MPIKMPIETNNWDVEIRNIEEQFRKITNNFQ